MSCIIHDGELYHYGVKGMKWGKRRKERSYAKKLLRAGRYQGEADYSRSRGEEEYRKHESSAKVFDKTADKYESEGKYFRAEAARRSAAAIRSRGQNIKNRWDQQSSQYQIKADTLKQKASAFATKKRVDAGKDIVEQIFSDARNKAFKRAEQREIDNKAAALRDKLGDDRYETLKKIRGTY